MKFMRSIIFGLVTTLLFTLTGCIDEKEIRDRDLKETPVGTKFEVVLVYCAAKKLKCDNSKKAGYLINELAKRLASQASGHRYQTVALVFFRRSPEPSTGGSIKTGIL